MDRSHWALEANSGCSNDIKYYENAIASRSTSVSDAERSHKRKGDIPEVKSSKRIRVDGRDGKVTDFRLRSQCYWRTSVPASTRPTTPIFSASLPQGLWTKIFEHLPPDDLGRLMRVNSAFKSWLSSPLSFPPSHQLGCAPEKRCDPESIWKQARRRTHGHLPRPLYGFSELEMWRLVGGWNCELCVHHSDLINTDDESAATSSRSNSIPEQGNTRIYWAFGVRICLDCFYNIALPVGSLIPSYLYVYVSYVFLTT
jgi:hypothetical protein